MHLKFVKLRKMCLMLLESWRDVCTLCVCVCVHTCVHDNDVHG
jgi:hypothetical protein